MEIKENQKLSEYTTMGIGGPTPALYLPENERELADLVKQFTNDRTPYRILGKGSNILVDDRGVKEVVICTRSMQRIFEVNEASVTADAGYPVAQLAYQTASRGLTGLEFAIGIPGSLGGVIRMNAGAHQRSMSDIVDTVRMVLGGGHLVTAGHEELQFSYRASAVPDDAIITAATLELRKGDDAEIHERIRKYNDQRTSTQPLREKSAGCIFKNPGGASAGKLIEDSRLKNCRMGGAVVSDIHANFIVNKGAATFQDAMRLIEHIKKTVHAKMGFQMQEEVILWRYE